MYNETTRLVKVVMPENAGDGIVSDGIVSGDSPLLLSTAPTTDSGAIMLSDTAENLFIAYEVVAMVKDESTGKTHFSQLRWKKLGEIEIDGGDAKSVADPSGDGEQIGVKGALRDGMGAATEEELPLYYQFMFESGDLFVAAAADEYPALDGDELQMLSDDSSSGGGSGGSTGGGVLVVHGSATTEDGTTTLTIDTTYADIAAAGFCVLEYVHSNGLHKIMPLIGYGSFGNEYVVIFDSDEYLTDSENGYPAYTYTDESQQSH